MRAAAAVLVLAISQIGVTLCLTTCSAPAREHAAGVPSCHEAVPEADGPTVGAVSACGHPDEAGFVGITPTLVTMLDRSAARTASAAHGALERSRRALLRSILPTPSPPLLPLRI